MSTWEVGSQVGPYVLIAEIGAGSMGDVWKARDTRLDRIVAIKRLRVPSAAIEREARTIASLNHPHICTLHDIGSDYLVMEYVDGAPPVGPMQPAEAVRLALQIASALEAAHSKGIIHRDLKPANILVSGGRAKLLDFGIAKARAAAMPSATMDATMTAEAVVSGTPAYMAPEQVEAAAADARSDIFTFGAVLYEMLSGRRAFQGSSGISTMTSVLRDEPPPLDTVPALSRVVKRCLEKSPARRYQSVAELLVALEQMADLAAKGPSIAVLPFENLSSDREQEYFSDGLTEEIINALAHVEGLKVIARTSAFAFKGQHVPIGRIADALGVTTILEGSVRRAGSRIRVTAQLIDVASGFHLWSERYDRELADVFAVQDDIASAIAKELRGRLAIGAPAATYTPKIAAYEAYLMARHHVWRLTPDSFEQGFRGYERAISLDPAYALPHAALAELFHIRASNKGAEAREAATRIRPALERAVALDPRLPEAHAWLGILATTYDYDWAEAERRFNAAMASEPVAPAIRHLNAYFRLRFIGRADEAVAEHHRALEKDPLNLMIRVGLAASLTSAGRDVEAAQEASRVLELAPDFTAAYTLLARNVAREPLDVALAFAERLHTLAFRVGHRTGLLAGLLRRSGDEARAAALMAEAGPPEEYGHAVDYALFHLASGETDRAFDFMQLLVAQRHPFLMMILVGGPYAPALRASSRWASFARAIGLPS